MKTLVLSPLPPDDPEVSDPIWMDAARLHARRVRWREILRFIGVPWSPTPQAHARTDGFMAVGLFDCRKRVEERITVQERSHTVCIVNGRSCESYPFVIAIIVSPSSATA